VGDRRLIVLSFEVSNPENVVAVIHELSTIRRHGSGLRSRLRFWPRPGSFSKYKKRVRGHNIYAPHCNPTAIRILSKMLLKKCSQCAKSAKMSTGRNVRI